MDHAQTNDANSKWRERGFLLVQLGELEKKQSMQRSTSSAGGPNSAAPFLGSIRRFSGNQKKTRRARAIEKINSTGGRLFIPLFPPWGPGRLGFQGLLAFIRRMGTTCMLGAAETPVEISPISFPLAIHLLNGSDGADECPGPSAEESGYARPSPGGISESKCSREYPITTST